MDELLEQFVIEGRELVQQAVDGLLALEQTGYEAEAVDSVFRAIHTLKGSAGLFDAAPLGAALHAAESVIAAARAARQTPRPEALDALLDCCSQAEAWVETMARSAALPGDAAARSQALVSTLQAAMGAAPEDGAAGSAPDGLTDGLPDGVPDGVPDGMPDWVAGLLAADPEGRARTAIRYEPAPGCFFLGDDPLALMRAVPGLLAVRIAPRKPWDLAAYDPFRCNLVLLALSAAPPEAVRAPFRLVPDQAVIRAMPGPADEPAPAPTSVRGAASRFLRVEESRIDGLAELVSELFAAKTRLAHTAAQAAGVAPDLARALSANQAEFDRLIGALHRSLMRLRMVPLDQSLRRLPRVVREVAARLGREVAFSIEGAETEADRATVDLLYEPLLHVLRNALDHGVEPPEVRHAKGKPAQGRIVLRAGLQGEQLVVTVTDDGAGIDPAALRRSAAARGVASAAALAAMDDAAALDLVFLPGFSTASEVTETSGRGVGMDAARRALQVAGGRVSIAPADGGGTVVRLTVPQSIAITTIVIVTAGGEAFGVPIACIEETARLPRAAIRPLGGGRAFVLRARTIPLLSLAALLGSTARADAPEAKVLILSVAGHPVGLEVDRFGARLDVVVRPLHGLLAGLRGLSGAALLGDGRVLLILNPPALLP
jgi:two-component system chemotaxis sensor kinase CheA